MHQFFYGTKQPLDWRTSRGASVLSRLRAVVAGLFRRRWARTAAIVGTFFLASFLLTRHDRFLRHNPFVSVQQHPAMTSPDGRFRITMDTKEGSDQLKYYSIKLIDNTTAHETEIVNCTRRDLPPPNFYWDRDSRYLVIDRCSESWGDSGILIVNLLTKQTEFELTGLTGNSDPDGQQFDQTNGVLFYFDTSVDRGDAIPDLYAFYLSTKTKKKLLEFDVTMDFEFPAIERKAGERKITVRYSNIVTLERFRKEIIY